MNSYRLTAPRLVLLAAVFLAAFYNFAFYRSLLAVYPVTWGRLPFLGSITLVLICFTSVSFIAVSSKYILKPLLILVLLASSVASYFMNTFNIVIDAEMLRNVAQTDTAESMDLMNLELLAYFLLLGVLPSVLIFKARVHYGSLKTEALSKLKYIAALVLTLLVTWIAFSSNFYSFFREQKHVRLYANPVSWMYATYKYSFGSMKAEAKTVRSIGEDAAIPEVDNDRELIILVVGGVRADKFSLNGYPRETKPASRQRGCISFTNFSRAERHGFSVPCMFSVFGRKGYSGQKARETENLLDVLSHAGISVLGGTTIQAPKGLRQGGL
jgi:lipid A ethanolaminephosphotransferase